MTKKKKNLSITESEIIWKENSNMRGSLYSHMYVLKSIHRSRIVLGQCVYNMTSEQKREKGIKNRVICEIHYALLLTVLTEVFMHMSLKKEKTKSFKWLF